MSDIKQLYEQINDSFSHATKVGGSGAYQGLASIFSDSEASLREYIQEITRKEVNKIIQALESGGNLSGDDLKYIKLWIVGDAEHYVKLENNFDDWLAELKRIVDEINKINEAHPDFDTASKLRALIEDGKRVIYDIAYFLEKKERIAYFEESTRELDKEEKAVLVKLLKDKLASKEF